MFHVLIVEDERRTARSIAQLVNEHPDFHVAGLAANGAEALVFLGGNPVDLILTDIRMPGIDGMQLLEILQKQFPRCLSIVLSGYSEFEYAKAAIQYNAFNYLLKPVDQDELFRVLDSAARLLEEQRQTRRRLLIRKALDGQSVPESFSVYLLIVQGVTADFWSQANQLSSLHRYFGRDCQMFASTLDSERLLVVPDSQSAPEQANRYFRAIQPQIDVPIQMICTTHPVALAELNTLTKQLHRTLEQNVRLFRSGFFTANLQTPPSPYSGTPLRALHPDQAVEAICAQNRDALQQCLTQALRVSVRRADVQNYLFTIIRDPRLSYQLSPGKLDRLKTQLTEIITNATNPEPCVEQLTTLLFNLQRSTENKRNLSDLAETLAQHLEANYHLPISFDALAKQYGVGTRHLNKIFKEHKGVRPSEYLLSLRMEHAKAILESKPDAMIKDVASSVGYNDPLYFSKVFQRTTGHWPTEYQQSSHNKRN